MFLSLVNGTHEVIDIFLISPLPLFSGLILRKKIPWEALLKGTDGLFN